MSIRHTFDDCEYYRESADFSDTKVRVSETMRYKQITISHDKFPAQLDRWFAIKSELQHALEKITLIYMRYDAEKRATIIEWEEEESYNSVP